ncbi:MAG: PEP-utilizing enzyme [Oscillospiraceae bacterium]
MTPTALKKAQAIGKGLAASPGAACGQVVFTAEDAKEWAERGEKVVLVRLETSPEDIEGMDVSQGILTVRGGMTSHAAVVARGMGTCCVSGCGDIKMDEEDKQLHPGRQDLSRRATISPWTAPPATSTARPSPPWTLPSPATSAASWAGPTRYRTLKVRTNADNPRDAAQARELRRRGHRPVPHRAHVL